MAIKTNQRPHGLKFLRDQVELTGQDDPTLGGDHVEGGVEGRLDVLEDVALVADDLKEKQTLEILGH